MSGWTAADVPDLAGRVAVVTGGNAGIGLETARVLAERGATVVLACRDERKADQAAGQIRSTAPDADVRLVHLDLASLGSVRQAAAEILAGCPRLDLLINNAGRDVRAVPAHRGRLRAHTRHQPPGAISRLPGCSCPGCWRPRDPGW